jgi:tripartite-type tricarboxylate transporter receptor subunit TctC
MIFARRRFLATAASALAGGSASLLSTAVHAQAEAFPARPIKLVLGFPAGGALDIVARAIAQHWSERLGKPIVIENRAGAGGTLAAANVAKSAPDGYTALFVSSGHAANVSLYRHLPYDTLADFEPVGMAAIATPVLVMNPKVGANNLAELIAIAKARPGSLNIYSSGVGSSSHIAAMLFSAEAGVSFKYVPYKGTAEAVRDLVSGDVHVGIDAVPALLPFIRDTRLKALAVGTRARTPLLPEVPTFDEAGLRGFTVYNWGGFLVPARTPKSRVDKLNTELRAALRMPELRAQLAQMAMVPQESTQDDFRDLIKSEIGRMARIVAASGGPTQ